MQGLTKRFHFYFIYSSLTWRESQRMVPRPATSSSPESLLDVLSLDSPSTSIESESPGLEPDHLSFSSPSR